MWRTPLGDRTLVGAEYQLFRELLGYVYDQLDVIHAHPDAPYRVGIVPFDRLQQPQQLAVLFEVAAALLTAETPAPELTAVREATVSVLLQELRIGIEIEIDSEEYRDVAGPTWRELLLAVFLEDGEESDELPDLTSSEIEEWDYLIDAAASRILWDQDWDLEDLIVDSDPDKAAMQRKIMRISDNYFQDVPPEPAGVNLVRLRRDLNELTGANH